MPLAPVAYEAAVRPARASYETKVREVLSTLGSANPDEDIAATGPLLENSKRAKMDPAAAAGIIYATSRHRHPPTSVLGAADDAEDEAGLKWRLVKNYREIDIYAAKIIDGLWAAKAYSVRYPSSGIWPALVNAPTKERAVRGVEKDIDKTISKFEYGYRRLTHSNPSATASSEVRAEDSSPAPCTKPTRTVSDECQRIAKEIGPIRSDKELYALVAPQMRKETQEVFYVVCCDVHGNLVGFTEVARGQVSRVAVDVEDVLGAVLAIKPRPTAYAICHNHPSSKPRPSDADKALTEAIRKAGAVAIPNTVFLDHLVIAGGDSREYYSFSEGRVRRA